MGRGFVVNFQLVGKIFSVFVGLFTGATATDDLGGPNGFDIVAICGIGTRYSYVCGLFDFRKSRFLQSDAYSRIGRFAYRFRYYRVDKGQTR